MRSIFATACRKWQGGFIDGDDLKTVCDDASMVAWAWDKPTLVVVDYAATFGEALHRCLGRLVDHAKADAPALRVLLLECQADEQTGWWRTVFGGGKARDQAIQERLDPNRPIDIQPLPASHLRREIFDDGHTCARDLCRRATVALSSQRLGGVCEKGWGCGVRGCREAVVFGQTLMQDIETKGGSPVTQMTNITGDHNKSTQISGSGNSVNM